MGSKVHPVEVVTVVTALALTTAALISLAGGLPLEPGGVSVSTPSPSWSPTAGRTETSVLAKRTPANRRPAVPAPAPAPAGPTLARADALPRDAVVSDPGSTTASSGTHAPAPPSSGPALTSPEGWTSVPVTSGPATGTSTPTPTTSTAPDTATPTAPDPSRTTGPTTGPTTGGPTTSAPTTSAPTTPTPTDQQPDDAAVRLPDPTPTSTSAPPAQAG